MNNLFQMEDVTNQFDRSDAEQNKVMGVLAYLNILFLIPLFTSRNSRFAMFHVNQGIILAVVEIVCGAVIGILSHIPIIGIIASIAGGLLGLICLALAVLGLINAAVGRAVRLPIIGSITIIR